MSVNPNSISSELEYITKEMYKKNLELAQHNKILMLLRKIEELILSTVVDIDIISREVTKIIVNEAGFTLCTLHLVDKNNTSLNPLSVTFSETIDIHKILSASLLSTEKILLQKSKNLLSESVKTRKIQRTTSIEKLNFSFLNKKECIQIQKILQINEFIVYPLIASERVIGIMLVGIGQNNDFNYEQQKELLDTLPNIVSIALDNSLLYQTIENANTKLKELDQLKDEFVSIASHELRTPMTAIKSYLWMALDGQGGPLKPKQKFYLQRSYDSTDRLIKLVNNMLNISRIDSGRLTLELDKVDLLKLSQDVIFEVAPRAEELGIKINLISNNSLSPVVADADKVKEVLINLIGNSIKFTPKNGSITISFEKIIDEIVTHVTDTGAGLTPDMIKNLFQKFGLVKGSYQTNQTSSSQGTGLGLYICKQIIELHHGKIFATSKGVSQGSVFSYSLPTFSNTKLKLYQKQFQNTSKIGIIHSKI